MIIRRPYANLEEELRRIGNVTVIVDRRDRARRGVFFGVAAERRYLERRLLKEELGEMIIVTAEAMGA